MFDEDGEYENHTKCYQVDLGDDDIDGDGDDDGSRTSAHDPLINIPQFIPNPPNFH